jgi:hypothetical protein
MRLGGNQTNRKSTARPVLVALAVAVATLAAASLASGAVGSLTYGGCITGETESGPPGGGGTGACEAISNAFSGGNNSGLASLESVVVSGDGKWTYAGSGGDDAVARFRRNRDTGKLTYRGCISGDKDSACKEIPNATAGGFGEQSGLDNLQALALSRDGKSLYTASSGDAAVARFRRNRDTGKLAYRGCVSGEGDSACKEIPSATPDGDNSGLANLKSVGASADGKTLYTASGDDSAVARFRRNRDTGKLTYRGCITGEKQSGPPGGGGTGACEAIATSTPDGGNSGLADLEVVVPSRDGTSLYAAAGDDAAVARFRRNRDTGRLTYKGCISGDDESACNLILHATPGGFGEQSGLDNPQGIALSGDGKSLYTASFGDSAVGRFRRER